MHSIRRIASVLVLSSAALLSFASMAQAQGIPFNGARSSILPNYPQTITSLTATAQSAVLPLPGVSFGMIEVKATTLTTVTWQLSGSVDGGLTYTPIYVAPFGGALPLVPVTTAQVSTVAAGTWYAVNLAGFTNVKVTTSGTFTATGLTIKLVSTSNKGAL